MFWKVSWSDATEVSVVNVSMMAEGLLWRTCCLTVSRDEGVLARRARAKLLCEGDERIRAIPVP
jgi:hypothetical protein